MARTITPPSDRRTLQQLYDLAETMSLPELQRFCEGSMNALIVVQQVFRNRFPDEFDQWEQSDFFQGDVLKVLSGDRDSQCCPRCGSEKWTRDGDVEKCAECGL